MPGVWIQGPGLWDCYTNDWKPQWRWGRAQKKQRKKHMLKYWGWVIGGFCNLLSSNCLLGKLRMSHWRSRNTCPTASLHLLPQWHFYALSSCVCFVWHLSPVYPHWVPHMKARTRITFSMQIKSLIFVKTLLENTHSFPCFQVTLSCLQLCTMNLITCISFKFISKAKTNKQRPEP